MNPRNKEVPTRPPTEHPIVFFVIVIGVIAALISLSKFVANVPDDWTGEMRFQAVYILIAICLVPGVIMMAFTKWSEPWKLMRYGGLAFLLILAALGVIALIAP